MIVSEIVFACHEKACAPPPAGRGGSLPSRGGGSGKGYIVTASYDHAGNRIDNQPERTPMGALKHHAHHPSQPGGRGLTPAQQLARSTKGGTGKLAPRTQAERRAAAAKLSQDGTTNTANPGGLGGGSAGRKVKVTSEDVVNAAKYGISPHTGKPYSKKNPPPGQPIGKKTTLKEMEEEARRYAHKYVLSEHD